jgi:hypothetical protein
MNSTSNLNSKDVLGARTDEQLARVGERIASAHELIARVDEQLSKLERDHAGNPSAGAGQQRLRGSRAARGPVGLLLAGCVVVAALVLQSSGDGVKPIVARSAPQLASISTSSPANPPSLTQPAPSFQVIAAEAAAPAQAEPPAPAAPQDAAPASAGSYELKQMLQAMARDVSKLERAIEELKAKQEQIVGKDSNAIEQLKAKQEDMARLLAKLSEHTTLTPPAGPTPASKPMPSPSQQVRARPSRPRAWPYSSPWRYYYEEW